MSAGSQQDDRWTRKTWNFRPNHRQATQNNYEAARHRSGQKRGVAQYHPINFASDEAVMRAEIDCVETGILIDQTDNVRSFYKELELVVGVCSGEETCFIYAEWHDGGPVHGRPISSSSLRNDMRVTP